MSLLCPQGLCSIGPGMLQVLSTSLMNEWSQEAESGKSGLLKFNSIFQFTAATDEDHGSCLQANILGACEPLCTLELGTADK